MAALHAARRAGWQALCLIGACGRVGLPECGRMPKYLFRIVLEDTRTRPASFPVVDEVVGEPVSLPEHKETRQRG